MKLKLRSGRGRLNKIPLAAGLLLWCLATQGAAQETIGVIGDSISTGAVANPALRFDAMHLWQIFRGETALPVSASVLNAAGVTAAREPLKIPQRLPPSLREYTGSLDWVGKNILNIFSNLYLDTEQYSWSYILGLGLGLDNTHLLIAAEDGARMKNAIRQIDRILAYTKGEIPSRLFIFYTGNDLCGPTMDFVTTGEEFSAYLDDALKYLQVNGKPAAGGSTVYVVAPLGVLQITTSPEIQQKQIQAHGQTMTCKEVSEYKGQFDIKPEALAANVEMQYFFRLFPKTPTVMCPTVFGQNMDYQPEQSVVLANRIREFRRVSQDIVSRNAEALAKGNPGLKLKYISGTEKLIFSPEHIAADCFHLSVAGQKLVADEIAKDL